MAKQDARATLQAVPVERPVERPADAPPALKSQAAPAAAPAATEAAAPATPPTTPFYQRPAARIGAGLALLAAAYFGGNWLLVGRYLVSTDDAYLRADMSVLAAKVPGYITQAPVKDNTPVKAGDVLLAIDDGDYKLAVDAARAKIETQDATVARLGQQVAAQRAGVEQAEAQIVSVEADVARTAADYARATTLAKSQYASIKTLDQSRADAAKATASVTSAKAALTAAKANLSVAEAQKTEAERLKAELQSSLAKAERDLSFTRVVAPFDGIVANRAAQLGDYVQPGSRLLALVPVNTVYAEANFKETQLARMTPGQPVTITVDALSGRQIKGEVESLAPASGSQFSLLPPENATGNFTKIVQRVPVRIKLPASAIADGGLRVGLSVTATVDTRTDGASPKAAAQKP
jgi:membrane fusion protein, multidrug efflux system